MIYLELFLSFFKTGCFAIGGGLATLPFLYEISETYAWFSAEEIANMLAVSEATPGPIGVNMATYAGFTAGGVLGALTATFALILPAFIFTILIAAAISRFRDNRFVNAAFLGIRPAVVGLITVAFTQVLQASLLIGEKDATGVLLSRLHIPALLLGVALYALMHFRKKIHPIFIVLLGAVFGILCRL